MVSTKKRLLSNTMLTESVTHSRWPALSALLLFFGFGTVALIIIHPPYEKIAIVGSTFGIFIILVGIWLLGRSDISFHPAPSRPWLCFLPVIIGISVNLSASLVSPAISALALAAVLTLSFLLFRAIDVSKVYVAFLVVFLAALVGYNVFCYYPLITSVDSWRNLSVASAIVQTGHYADVIQPTDAYYFQFPVMSIAPSILSSVTGLNLELSLLLFPGSLILLQPLLVFLLSRLVFYDVEAAAFSAFIVLTESQVTQWISGPIPQPIATSLLLLLLILLFGRVRSRGHVVGAFVVLLMLTAMHGAVGLLSIFLVSFLILRERSSYKTIILPLVVIFLGYVMITEVVDNLVRNTQMSLKSIFEWIFTPTFRTGSELYGTSSNGLIFIWWGLPVSLALFYISVLRRKQACSWAYAGLGLLGLSFAVNLVAPSLVIDRYGGLAAWLVLATIGGKALTTLTRTSRQLLMLVPIVFLICLSGVLDPTLSPQYAYQGYQDVLPTTKLDRTALDWVNSYVAGNVFADSQSARYLGFSRYSSGVFFSQSIFIVPPHEVPSTSKQGIAVFIRLSRGSNQQKNQTVNIPYDNSRCVLETDEGWR
jgi:hypothetical protein